MPTTVKTFLVPFDSNTGNLIPYCPEWATDGIKWVENKVFTATLQYWGYDWRQRYLVMKADDGKIYPLHLADLDAVLRKKIIRNGFVSGYWSFSKLKDNRYGICLCGEQGEE